MRQYYWLEEVVRVQNVVTKFRKCRVIMFKIDTSWQSILTLKLRRLEVLEVSDLFSFTQGPNLSGLECRYFDHWSVISLDIP